MVKTIVEQTSVAPQAEYTTEPLSKPFVLNAPFGEENPYQRMMYWPSGSDYTVLPAKKNFQRMVKLANTGEYVAMHLHWDDLIFHFGRKEVTSVRENKNLSILNALEEIKAAGLPLIFTVHNARPHSPAVSLDTFRNVRQRVCDLSDIVHVHTSFAADHVIREYSVDPKKVVLIPHPSYLGVYESAELTLGRTASFSKPTRFLFFGAFRRNKGVSKIVDALNALERNNRHFHATVVGRVRERARSGIEQSFEHFGDKVSLILDRILDDDIPALFSGSHFFLAPFDNDVLSSGTIMLAQTFGLPVIGSDTPAMRSMLPTSNHPFLFDQSDAAGFARKIRAACDLGTRQYEEARCGAFEVAEAYSPQQVALKLSHEIDNLLSTSSSSPDSSIERRTLATPLKGLAEMLNIERPVEILDVGANPMGRSPVYQKLINDGLCKVTGFDPQRDTLEDLEATKSDHETYLPYALGDGGQHLLNVYRGSGLTSLLELRRQTVGFLRGLRRAAKLVDQVSFQTFRLDDLSEIKTIDLLKIDIQGSELIVMENAKQLLSTAVAIQAEVSFFPLYDNQPTFGEIDVFLRGLGFVPFNFVDIERRRINHPWSSMMPDQKPGQMLDGDIIYLRDLSEPEKIDSTKLRMLSLLASGVFDQSDLVFRCLDVLVQRQELNRQDVDNYISLHM